MRNDINRAPQEEVTISKVKCDHVTMATSEEVNTLTEATGIIRQIHPKKFNAIYAADSYLEEHPD